MIVQSKKGVLAMFRPLQAAAITPFIVAACVAGIAGVCRGDVVLTFEGLHDLEPVMNFYNGGYGGGDAIAQTFYPDLQNDQGEYIHQYDPAYGGAQNNYGITFSDNALAIVSGGNGVGDFSDNPSGDTVAMIAPFADKFGYKGVTMNILHGWTNSTFKFFYCTSSDPDATISIYDKVGGPAGGGHVIASSTLPESSTASDGDWRLFSLPFTQTAYSVYFSASLGADNIMLSGFSVASGDDEPTAPPAAVPEPTAMLLWSAFLLLGTATGARYCGRRAPSSPQPVLTAL